MLIAESSDLWGAAVPAWLGAIGTIGASVVAVIALLVGRQAKGGVQQIALGSNESQASARQVATEPVAGNAQVDFQLTADAEVHRAQPLPVTWKLDPGGSGLYWLRNTSPQTAILTSVETVDGNTPISLRSSLPASIPGGADIEFRIHRLMGGPSVIGLRIDWTEDDGLTRQWVFYLV